MSRRLVGGPAGFRRLLERLGPTFVKIGQFLALRPDLIPQEYCDELMRLLDRVPPFPWDEARAVFREDLGAEPSEVFAFMNPSPFAAGSLAQVHLARTRDGDDVAVKIQRPGIRGRVMRDLGRARTLARLLDLSGATLVADPRDIVRDLTSWLIQELDFTRELANLTRMYRLAANSPFERIPRPYPNLSGPRVLTAEYLPGVPLSELLSSLHSGRAEQAERVSSLDIDRNRVAINLITATLRQIFQYQFFDADNHPGNLLVMPGEVIGFVDFGLCDELDSTVRDRQLRYLAASYGGQTERVFRALADILIPTELTDMEAFRRDFLAETRARTGGTATDNEDVATLGSGRSFSQRDRSPLADYVVRLMRSARRNHLQVPTSILSMYRAIITADTVARQLGARADLSSVGQQFFARLRVDETLKTLEPENLQPTLFSLLELIHEAPDQVRQILEELSDGSFTINVNSFDTPRVAHAQDRRTRLLAASILAVSIALLVAAAPWPVIDGFSSRWLPVVILLFVYGWILFRWRRLS